jgi:DNA-binding transcriptional MerR regulator
MSDGGLSIGDLATRTGRSVHTIRWYESQGLMPGVARDAGGRRVYHASHVGWLELIDRLRTTGMSVAEMREYTALVRQGRSSLRQRKELLEAHRARAEATIAQWRQSLALIDSKIVFYDEWLATGQPPPLPAPRSGASIPPAGAPRRRRAPKP